LLGAARGDLLGGEVRVEGENPHPEEAAAERREARSDMADADDADRLSRGVAPHIGLAVDARGAPHAAIALDDALREAKEKRERVLRHGLGVAARLVDDENARLGAGLEIDRVVARAVSRDGEEVRRAR